MCVSVYVLSGLSVCVCVYVYCLLWLTLPEGCGIADVFLVCCQAAVAVVMQVNWASSTRAAGGSNKDY